MNQKEKKYIYRWVTQKPRKEKKSVRVRAEKPKQKQRGKTKNKGASQTRREHSLFTQVIFTPRCVHPPHTNGI